MTFYIDSLINVKYINTILVTNTLNVKKYLKKQKDDTYYIGYKL